MGSTYLANLKIEIELPRRGISTQVIQNDEHVRITAFGFAAGEEIETHSSPLAAMLYFLEGEADVQLDREICSVEAGSFINVEPFMLHGMAAKSPVRMVRVQVKAH